MVCMYLSDCGLEEAGLQVVGVTLSIAIPIPQRVHSSFECVPREESLDVRL